MARLNVVPFPVFFRNGVSGIYDPSEVFRENNPQQAAVRSTLFLSGNGVVQGVHPRGV
jgi:hypothetical protein